MESPWGAISLKLLFLSRLPIIIRRLKLLAIFLGDDELFAASVGERAEGCGVDSVGSWGRIARDETESGTLFCCEGGDESSQAKTGQTVSQEIRAFEDFDSASSTCCATPGSTPESSAARHSCLSYRAAASKSSS